MMLNVVDFLEQGALRRFSDKAAIVDGGRVLTFAELAADARCCATQLVRRLDKVNQAVAVYLPKCAETVIANLGIVYSGNAYCNLDIKSPAQRIRNILDKIGPACAITSRALAGTLRDIVGPDLEIACVEDLLEGEINDALLQDRLRRVIDTDPLCIINTSGSTGTPKGVALSHRGTIDFMGWLFATFDFDESVRIGSLSPLYFDIYILELFLCLYKGATLVFVPEQTATFPARLLEFLHDQRISFLFWVPSIMVAIANLDLLGKYDLAALENIFFAGEVFPTKQLNHWRRTLPKARFVNLYGPIEIHVDCTYFIVDREFDDDEPLPIGRPCRNTDILILDDEGHSCAPGERGELCVRGSSLALGYWNDPDKTARAFAQNPLNTRYPERIYRTGDVAWRREDGEIFLVGRKDFQIKHMGYRIDLQEIEHQVHCVEGIGQACVLYNQAVKEITLFYEVLSADVEPAHIRRRLAEIFPKYMIPTAFRSMASLPRNPNGKVDRNGLAILLSSPQ
ncbi:amino acid adenylation domain-containing protein [Rhodanobacter hydrolyticus]|uniref:Amino acid adenylation domain-containing protein n=1 Tax=Rhodanobacter hydrolyticus TaxID=2250595 RepID=A0ABW8J8D9_9GAMM